MYTYKCGGGAMNNSKRFGVMLDMSRNAVMKLSELNKFL